MDHPLPGPSKLPALVGLFILELVFLYPLLVDQYQYYLQSVSYSQYDDVVKSIMDKYNTDVEANQRAREAAYKERTNQKADQQVKPEK